MEITEVRIKLMEEAGERLHAFCSITFDDCFVIRDLKIIEGTNGPFVAMPSRKLTAHCTSCGYKNHLRAAYCNQCGTRLSEDRVIKDEEGRAKLYADIAHPINSRCREMIQDRVIATYREEVQQSKKPGYVCRYDEFGDEDGRTPAPHIATTADRASGDGRSVRSDGARNTTRVRAADPGPRPPHRPPEKRASEMPRQQGQRPSGFGEGIF